MTSTLEANLEQSRAEPREGQLAGPLPVAMNAQWAERRLLTIALVVADLLAVLAGFWFAYLLRFEAGFDWLYQHEVPQSGFYSGLVLLTMSF